MSLCATQKAICDGITTVHNSVHFSWGGVDRMGGRTFSAFETSSERTASPLLLNSGVVSCRALQFSPKPDNGHLLTSGWVQFMPDWSRSISAAVITPGSQPRLTTLPDEQEQLQEAQRLAGVIACGGRLRQRKHNAVATP
jgi:hypothetical protein